MSNTEQASIIIDTRGASLDEKLEGLPTGPGVYQHKDADGKVLYVGKAKSLRGRVRQYFQKSRRLDARMEAMLAKATDLEIIVTDSEVEALILEANLIKKLKPRYNVNLKDDKSYPYIVITNEPFPRVFVTRQVRRDGARYFGPYTDVKNVRAALKSVRDIFMIRSCNYLIDEESIRRRKIKVCLDYHIKKCEGPCEGLVSMDRYRSMINQVAQVLEGKTGKLIRDLERDMVALADQMRFEDAALLRDRMKGLKAYSERQKAVSMDLIDRDVLAFAQEGNDACGVVFRIRDGKMIGRHHYYMANVEYRTDGEILEPLIQQHYLGQEYIPAEILLSAGVENAEAIGRWLTGRRGEAVHLLRADNDEDQKLVKLSQANARFLLDEFKLQKMKRADYVPHGIRSLQKELRLDKPPRRMECFDISNIQGADTVASMVVFVDGRPKKAEYRKFRIRSTGGPDDFASMREVVKRRYERALAEGLELPDLVVIDGGKGQLSSAVEVLQALGLADQPVIGLAKRLEEVFVPGKSDPEMIPKASTSLRLLQQIRDEAHRFAIAYHRTLRAKRTLQTELDLIEGIGKKRAKELLEAFGSVQGVKFATEEQLAEIVGAKVAEKIREYFGPEEESRPLSAGPGSVPAG
jgi:excinuclease ABC subunit C